jgi:Protein of unknown function (DUF4232)
MSMKLTFRATRRVLAGVAVSSAVALLPATAMAATAAPARSAQTVQSARSASPAWPAPRCTARQTLIWLGVGGGGGTAGTIFYPLQFTNVSRHTCSLIGFPKAAAISRNGHQIGKSSRALRMRHGFVVLVPGATAHAALGIIEAGNVCNHPVNAASLKVRAPHQGRSTQIPFAFQACHGKRVLVVGPVQPGVGIP